MCRLDEVDFDIVVYNNLTTEAIEASGQTLEEMLEAQERLLRRLTDPTRQRAIINLDGTLLAEVSLHTPARGCAGAVKAPQKDVSVHLHAALTSCNSPSKGVSRGTCMF